MIELKVHCDCGQKYKFDVEPVNNQMPFAVACPICKRDGTPKANAMLQQMAVFKPADAVAAAPVAIASIAPPTGAPARPAVSSASPVAATAPAEAAPRPASRLPSAPVGQKSNPFKGLSDLTSGDAEKWKWWYFVLAGICIGGYSVWQAYDQHRIKPLGSLFLAVFCVAIGIWDFQHKRKKRRAGHQNDAA